MAVEYALNDYRKRFTNALVCEQVYEENVYNDKTILEISDIWVYTPVETG